MYTPNREKNFEELEVTEECDKLSCHSYRVFDGSRYKEPVCMADSHGECVRVNQIASEVNQFIADNDDVFMYIQPVGE